jgi:hypothetical protein
VSFGLLICVSHCQLLRSPPVLVLLSVDVTPFSRIQGSSCRICVQFLSTGGIGLVLELLDQKA